MDALFTIISWHQFRKCFVFFEYIITPDYNLLRAVNSNKLFDLKKKNKSFLKTRRQIHQKNSLTGMPFWETVLLYQPVIWLHLSNSALDYKWIAQFCGHLVDWTHLPWSRCKTGEATCWEFRGSFRMSHAIQKQCKKVVIILWNHVY